MPNRLKFRGIPLYGKELVYGSLDIHKGEKGVIYTIRDNENNSKYDIDPKTVGQSTGLLDKKGKEIFESDIIQYQHPKNPSGKKLIGIFEWNNAGFIIRNIETNNITDFTYSFEIIGNRFENPELLK